MEAGEGAQGIEALDSTCLTNEVLENVLEQVLVTMGPTRNRRQPGAQDSRLVADRRGRSAPQTVRVVVTVIRPAVLACKYAGLGGPGAHSRGCADLRFGVVLCLIRRLVDGGAHEVAHAERTVAHSCRRGA